MFIPLITDRPLHRPTLVNHALIALNIAVFAGELVLARISPDALESWMGQLRLASHQHGRPWTFLTYAFLHDHTHFFHIAGNILILWVFGPNVEDRFGRIGYLLFYLGGAAVAGLLHVVADPHPVIGASGAVAAVTGAFLVLFPNTHVKTLVVFFFIGIYLVPAWVFIVIAIGRDFIPIGLKLQDGVAHAAHLGGYGFGIILSLGLLATRILSREPYDLFSIARHAARRRQFREVAFQRNAGPGRRPDFATANRHADSGPSEAVMLARAEVTGKIGAQDLAAAAGAYRRLLDQHAATPGATLLSRRHQYDLANFLFQSGDAQTAAVAYEAFLKGYPTDSEIPVIRLMLGLINARFLNDPVRAEHEITQALTGLPEGDHRDLAKQLLGELG